LGVALVVTATGSGAAATWAFLGFAGGSGATSALFALALLAFGSGPDTGSMMSPLFAGCISSAAADFFSILFGTSGLPVSSYSRAVFEASEATDSIAGMASGAASAEAVSSAASAVSGSSAFSA